MRGGRGGGRGRGRGRGGRPMFGEKGQFSLDRQLGLPGQKKDRNSFRGRGRGRGGESQNFRNFSRPNRDPRKPSVYQQAVSEFAKKEQEKAERMKQIEERNAARKESKKKRHLQRRQHLTFTSNGQPVMGSRIKLLLGKIQQNIVKDEK